MGVFATRAPHRPNPIGLSVVKIEKVAGLIVEVSGGDFLDGTPILDIKPYIAYADSVPEATRGWTAEADSAAVAVEWSDRACGGCGRARFR